MNSESNSEGKEPSQKHHTLWLYSQSGENQNSMILAEKQTHRWMEQNWDPEINPHVYVYGQIIFDKGPKNIEKRKPLQ